MQIFSLPAMLSIRQTLKRLLLCMSLPSLATTLPAWGDSPAELAYKVVAQRSHKPTLFTQGLEIHDKHFYESSGLYGKSMLVTYPIAEPAGTWARLAAPFTQKQNLPENFFAEGLTSLGDRLYLLTWQEKTLLVYNRSPLSYQTSFTYEGEGWGLTNDGKQLIRSDGSDTLYFHNPDNFAQTSRLKVTAQGEPVFQINELEYAQGFIWANIWHDHKIVKIDPHTGKVAGVLDLSPLVEQLALPNPEAVLNGIAWDAQKKGFWVTGKLWPTMFFIQLQ